MSRTHEPISRPGRLPARADQGSAGPRLPAAAASAAAGAGRQSARAAVPESVAAHARFVSERDDAARRYGRRHHAGPGHLADGNALGRDHERRRCRARARSRAGARLVLRRHGHSHVRRGPQSRRRSRRNRLPHDGGPVRQAAGQHGIGDEPSVPGARRLAHAGRAARAGARQVRALLGQSSARAAARGALFDRAHGRDARHGSRRAAAGRFRAARADHGESAPGCEGGRRRGARDDRSRRSARRRARDLCQGVGLAAALRRRRSRCSVCANT